MAPSPVVTSHVVTFLAGGVCAALGAAAVLLVGPRSAPPTAGPPAEDSRAIVAALEKGLQEIAAELRQEAAELRQEMASSRRAEPTASAPAPAPARRREPDASAEPPPVTVAPTARAEAVGAELLRRGDALGDPTRPTPFTQPIAALNQDHLHAMRSWDTDETLRRHWLFADELTCLAWFGAPDVVDRENETWMYMRPHTDERGRNTTRAIGTLHFQRGRLIRAITE